MSIFPVRLSKWFPADPESVYSHWCSIEDQLQWHKSAKECVRQNRCIVCGKRPEFRYAWGLHSIPWGHGWDEIWCSKKCLKRSKHEPG